MFPRSEKLQCQWIAWTAIGTTTMSLSLPEHNACDMTGAIAQAQALMPEVTRIYVNVGYRSDVVYSYNEADQTWKVL